MLFRHSLAAFLFLSARLVTAQSLVDDNIKTDQLGYRCSDRKTAVFADPQTGFNASSAYTPGSTIEVRRMSDNLLLLSGTPVAWNGGATHAQSGDRAWWFDFSALTATGDYYINDPANNKRSYYFHIGDDVYNDALKHALRMFYYQRCGTAKTAACAGNNYADNAVCHAGSLQDTDCRDVTNPGNTSLALDLSGGWHDAGDYNKYVNFTFSTLHYLLDAYEQNPMAFDDNSGIPESGNSIPDILDEIKYELDWLVKMQKADGSVLMKVSTAGFQNASPPSTDNAQRMYGAAASSATRTLSSIFAHAFIIYNTLPATQTYAATLLGKAQLAWTWLQNNPGYSAYANTGFASANPEIANYDQDARSFTAAVYLYAATGTAAYRNYVDNNYSAIHALQWTYWYPFEGVYQDALLYYCNTPGATAGVVNTIRTNCITSVSANNTNLLPAWNSQSDIYMAHMADADYVWGNNQFKSETAILFSNMLRYNLDPGNQTAYRDAAEGYVHFFHGVNAFSYCFLTNAQVFGGDKAVKEIYHGWFGDATVFDNDHNPNMAYLGPPPGFIPGGINASYNPDVWYSGPPISPPQNQPVQKCFKDWNTSWPENSWEITEIAIYTNAAYVKLLAQFADTAAITTALPAPPAQTETVRLYPNPSAGTVSIGGAAGALYALTITDLSGRVVFSKEVQAQEQVQLSSLSPAVYQCTLRERSGALRTEKLVLLK